MPNFSKLLPAHILQELQEALMGKAAARAKDVYEGQALEGLNLYHGTPHKFEPVPHNEHGAFDFTTNARKGEGAQSFGPGGYLTGDYPLAAHYATSLTKRRQSGIPASWKDALMQDKDGFMEYLRARSTAKLTDYLKVNPLSADTWVSAPWLGAPERRETYGGHFRMERPWLGTRAARVTTPGVAEYSGTAKEALKGEAVPFRLNTAEDGRLAAGMGRRLIDAGVRNLPPPKVKQRIIEGTEIPSAEYAYRAERLGRMGLRAEDRVDTNQLPIVRRNLNATNAAIAGASKGPKYRHHMSGNGATIDLRNIELSDTVRPRIYHAQTPATPSEMFSYDYPLEVTSPRVLGALEQIAQLHMGHPGGADFANMTGEEFIKALRDKAGSAKAVEALREAKIPGMYYKRAGRRFEEDQPPPQFKPDDHNFVWFDDPLLNITKREDKKHGGSV
jgi:hypothetical protein